MIFGGVKNIDDVKIGSKQIATVMKGVKTIWENWKYREGSLYNMTSNNWNEFVASGDPGGDSTNYYRAFDGDVNTIFNNLNGNLPPKWVQVMFPKSVRIKEIETNLGSTDSQDTGGVYAFDIYGIKPDGSQEILFSRINDGDYFSKSKHRRTVKAEQQETLFNGLRIQQYSSRGWGWFRYGDCLVTKWWDRGNIPGDLQSVSISGGNVAGESLRAQTIPSQMQGICKYRWYRSATESDIGTLIDGADSSVYTLTNDDASYYIYCTATYGNNTAKSNYLGTMYGANLFDMTGPNTPAPFVVTGGRETIVEYGGNPWDIMGHYGRYGGGFTGAGEQTWATIQLGASYKNCTITCATDTNPGMAGAGLEAYFTDTNRWETIEWKSRSNLNKTYTINRPISALNLYVQYESGDSWCGGYLRYLAITKFQKVI